MCQDQDGSLYECNTKSYLHFGCFALRILFCLILFYKDTKDIALCLISFIKTLRILPCVLFPSQRHWGYIVSFIKALRILSCVLFLSQRHWGHCLVSYFFHKDTEDIVLCLISFIKALRILSCVLFLSQRHLGYCLVSYFFHKSTEDVVLCLISFIKALRILSCVLFLSNLSLSLLPVVDRQCLWKVSAWFSTLVDNGLWSVLIWYFTTAQKLHISL